MRHIPLNIVILLVAVFACVNGTGIQEGFLRLPQSAYALGGRPLRLTQQPALVAATKRSNLDMFNHGRHHTTANAFFPGPIKINVRPPVTVIQETLSRSSSSSVPELSSEDQRQANFLETVDKIIQKAYEEGSVSEYAHAKRLLLEWNAESKPSAATLWRLAYCCHYLSDLDKKISQTDKHALIQEGFKYAENAVASNDRDPDAHKWMAILSGSKGNFEGGLARVRGGSLFNVHINRAQQLRPDDAHINFLKGFVQLQVGKLGRLERMAAANLFSNFPSATIKDAIESFRRADRLSEQPWKINTAYLAKSYYEDKNFAEARRCLKIAEDIPVKNKEDKDAEDILAELRRSL